MVAGKILAPNNSHAWPERADEVVPDVSSSDHFKDHARFFRSGAAGEWAERTNADDRARRILGMRQAYRELSPTTEP